MAAPIHSSHFPLKPSGEGLMQVIVDGKAIGNSGAREYYPRKAVPGLPDV